jgi:hypothetical protein
VSSLREYVRSSAKGSWLVESNELVPARVDDGAQCSSGCFFGKARFYRVGCKSSDWDPCARGTFELGHCLDAFLKGDICNAKQP